MQKMQSLPEKSNGTLEMKTEENFDYLFDDIDFSTDPFVEEEKPSQQKTKENINHKHNGTNPDRKALQNVSSVQNVSKESKNSPSKVYHAQNGSKLSNLSNVKSNNAENGCEFKKTDSDVSKELKISLNKVHCAQNGSKLKDSSNAENRCELKKTDSDIRKDLETAYFHDVDDIEDLFNEDWYGNKVTGMDFSTFKRCKVIDISYYLHETLLTVSEMDSSGEDIVRCRDFW